MVGLIARRLGEDIESRPDALNRLLSIAATRPIDFQSQVVSGLAAALAGWRKARSPRAGMRSSVRLPRRRTQPSARGFASWKSSSATAAPWTRSVAWPWTKTRRSRSGRPRCGP